MNSFFLGNAIEKQDTRYNYVVIKTVRHGTIFIVKQRVFTHTDKNGNIVGISWHGIDTSSGSRCEMFIPAEDIALIQIVDWTEAARQQANKLPETPNTLQA